MTGPLTLALDTSGAVSVGLARDREVLGTAVVSDRLAHVEQLLPLVRAVGHEAGVRVGDLDQIVVGLGPGPFTGLRVGVVAAQVLATTLGIRLHGICSLDVIAAQFADELTAADPGGPASRRAWPAEFVVATDARRREVYWARYVLDDGQPNARRLDGPYVGQPQLVPPLPVVGPGADLYPDRLEAVLGPRTLDPAVLATVGPELPDAGRDPLYLRRPDAAEPTRRKPVLISRPVR